VVTIRWRAAVVSAPSRYARAVAVSIWRAFSLKPSVRPPASGELLDLGCERAGAAATQARIQDALRLAAGRTRSGSSPRRDCAGVVRVEEVLILDEQQVLATTGGTDGKILVDRLG